MTCVRRLSLASFSILAQSAKERLQTKAHYTCHLPFISNLSGSTPLIPHTAAANCAASSIYSFPTASSISRPRRCSATLKISAGAAHVASLGTHVGSARCSASGVSATSARQGQMTSISHVVKRWDGGTCVYPKELRWDGDTWRLHVGCMGDACWEAANIPLSTTTPYGVASLLDMRWILLLHSLVVHSTSI